MADKTEAPAKPQSPLEMKDKDGHPLFFEADGEILVIPGTVPADTVEKEINEGIHHAGS